MNKMSADKDKCIFDRQHVQRQARVELQKVLRV